MVLVTGGTGLVGAHLLLRLLEAETPVKATYRPQSNLGKVKEIFSYYSQQSEELFSKITWVETSLNDICGLETAFENVTHVYHCAALISFDPRDYTILHKINAEGTTNIVNFCIAKNIQKLCYVSSVATIGKPAHNTFANEDDEWYDDYANVYALSKWAAEMEVWRGAQENLPVVILNPGVILGPGFWDTGSGLFFTAVSKKRTHFPPGGTGFVSVKDVVRIMVGVMDSPIVNERYIAVSDNLTYKEVLEKIAVGLNVAPPKKKLPFWLLEILWRLDWFLGFFGKKRKITKNTVLSLRHPVHYDNQKIKEALDFSFHPINEAITLCCNRFLEESC